MSRLLFPREHGAYGQLGVPLAVALASGRPGLVSIAFALVATAVFLAHEPLLRAMPRGTARATRRLERSVPGELLLASALAALAIPVALAGGVSLATAAWTWLAWALGFGAVTCAIHAAIIRRTHRDPRPARVIGVALIAAAFALVVVHPDPLAGALPLIAAAVALHALAPSPRHLRRVGWILMSATVATGICLLIVEL